MTATDNSIFSSITLITKLGNIFQEAGYELYLVGGSVRDVLMGYEPHDYDFTTDAHPQTIKDILNSVGVDRFGELPKVEALWVIGEKFGTIGAVVDGVQVEITTYRSEKYTNTRQPEVEFGDSIEEDLARRDFTMNAIAMNTQAPDRYTLIDPYKGEQDIRNKTIKFVGHPKARIMEDQLRMLRAVRFEGSLGFRMDAEAKFWVRSQSYNVKNISQERVQDELNKMLLSGTPSQCMRRLGDVGLMWEILPEIAKLKNIPQDSRWHFGNVFEHTMTVLDATYPSLPLRIAALFHDVGKAYTFHKTTSSHEEERITFHAHEKVGAAITSSEMRRLKYANGIRGKVIHMVKMHMRPVSLVNNGMSKKAVRKFIRDCYDNKYGVTVWDVLDLNFSDIMGHRHPNMAEYNALHDAVYAQQAEGAQQVQELDSPLDGHEIMALFPGRKPGPWIGELKSGLTEEVVCGKMEPDDKDAAEYYVFNQSMLGY